MKETKQIARYVLLDLVGSTAAWICLNHCNTAIWPTISPTSLYYWGAGYVLLWLMLSLFAGFYHAPFKRARLNDLISTIKANTIGSLVVLLVLYSHEHVESMRSALSLLGLTFGLQTLCTYPFRLLLLSHTIGRINRRKITFPTLVVGMPMAIHLKKQSIAAYPGLNIIGTLDISNPNPYRPAPPSDPAFPPILGKSFDELPELVTKHNITNIIITSLTAGPPLSTSGRVNQQLLKLKHVQLYTTTHQGNIRTSSIQQPLLHTIGANPMPYWQRLVKRIADYLLSLLTLAVLSPLLLVMMLLVRLSSPGPVIYKQERVGLRGRPFTIYKLRSMYINAEQEGPALSSSTDSRVTPIGRFMRRTHIDEIPNFVNVLKGDMSLVGPRPERQFYIDQILEHAPAYSLLLTMRPGITSWGQVKFGYAENVRQMQQRMHFDMLYLNNRSLLVDAKILIYTIITVLKGSWHR